MEINWIMELWDSMVIVAGKYGGWLNAKGKKACFIFWSICVGYWFFRNIHLCLWAQAFSCFISLGINVYGWINWTKKESNKENK